jgi:DNA-binding MarR family transcriptional regulator
MPSQEARLRDLEQIAMGAVAVTARAVAQAQPDLTLLQWRLLVLLTTGPSGASVTNLARGIGTGLPQASRLAARLRRKGLVSTYKDVADGRVTRVSLTPDGMELVGRIRGLRRDLITAQLDADEAAGKVIDDHELQRIAEVFGHLA